MILEQPVMQGPADVKVAPSSPMGKSVPQKSNNAVMGVPSNSQSAATRGCNSKEGLFNIGFLVLMFVLFYFMLIRPQQKQQKERESMLSSLKKGDKVVTTGGILGTITSINEEMVTLEVADRVRLKVVRSAVARKVDSKTGKNNENKVKEK